jgi:hypothetical protein
MPDKTGKPLAKPGSGSFSIADYKQPILHSLFILSLMEEISSTHLRRSACSISITEPAGQ